MSDSSHEAPASDQSDSLGTIDQYQITSALVPDQLLLAHDTVSDQAAVLRLMPEVRDAPESLDAVRDALKVRCSLPHPGIAQVKGLHRAASVDGTISDALVSAGDFLLVMEHIDGSPLRSWAKKFPGGKASLDDAAAVCRQIGAALDYLHSQELVCGDVSPDNIVVTPSGDAKLLDVALPQTVRSTLSRRPIDDDSARASRPYAAPEQLSGNRPSAGSDQYALAVLLYELVSGAVPFQGAFDANDVALVCHLVANVEPEPVAELEVHQNAALLRGLAKKVADRHDTCGGLLERVCAGASADESAAAVPAPVAAVPGPPTADTPPAEAADQPAAAAVTAVAAATADVATTETATVAAAEPEPPGSEAATDENIVAKKKGWSRRPGLIMCFFSVLLSVLAIGCAFGARDNDRFMFGVAAFSCWWLGPAFALAARIRRVGLGIVHGVLAAFVSVGATVALGRQDLGMALPTEWSVGLPAYAAISVILSLRLLWVRFTRPPDPKPERKRKKKTAAEPAAVPPKKSRSRVIATRIFWAGAIGALVLIGFIRHDEAKREAAAAEAKAQMDQIRENLALAEAADRQRAERKAADKRAAAARRADEAHQTAIRDAKQREDDAARRAREAIASEAAAAEQRELAAAMKRLEKKAAAAAEAAERERRAEESRRSTSKFLGAFGQVAGLSGKHQAARNIRAVQAAVDSNMTTDEAMLKMFKSAARSGAATDPNLAKLMNGMSVVAAAGKADGDAAKFLGLAAMAAQSDPDVARVLGGMANAAQGGGGDFSQLSSVLAGAMGPGVQVPADLQSAFRGAMASGGGSSSGGSSSGGSSDGGGGTADSLVGVWRAGGTTYTLRGDGTGEITVPGRIMRISWTADFRTGTFTYRIQGKQWKKVPFTFHGSGIEFTDGTIYRRVGGVVHNFKKKYKYKLVSCGRQTDAHVQAAEVRWTAYVSNGESGYGPAVTDKLYQHYEEQAKLAQAMIKRICGN